MGRIADEVQTSPRSPWTNKVDDILAELDDDDRAVVLGWLLGALGARVVSRDLADYDIDCSADSIDRWRHAQERGRGRVWG
jgi:hypothetical protein